MLAVEALPAADLTRWTEDERGLAQPAIQINRVGLLIRRPGDRCVDRAVPLTPHGIALGHSCVAQVHRPRVGANGDAGYRKGWERGTTHRSSALCALTATAWP